MNYENFLLSFCVYKEHKKRIMQNAYPFPYDTKKGLDILRENFIERFQEESNYNIAINSFFSESGIGKSFCALYLLEEFQKISNYKIYLYSDFNDFLLSKISSKSLILIDDNRFAKTGIGSVRIIDDFKTIMGIANRYKKISMIFTTTFDISVFTQIPNIHNFLFVLGYNKEHKKALSFLYDKTFSDMHLTITAYPSEKILSKYLIEKENHTSKILTNRTSNSYEDYIEKFDIDVLIKMKKKERFAFFTLKFPSLTKSEKEILVELVDLKFKNLV